MTIASMVLEVALGLLFLVIASAFVGYGPLTAFTRMLPVKRWSRILLGFFSLLATAALLIAAGVPFFAFAAAALALVIGLLLAFGARRSAGLTKWMLSVAIALSASSIAVLQPLGLKVLLLPKADPLPYKLVKASVLKTYDEGTWFEGIAAASDGTLYLSANRNLDFAQPDYYRRAEGSIIARRPDGSEKIVFATPRGTTAGVIAAGSNGVLYMTSNGARPCIWRIVLNGEARRLAELPAGAWPNGIAFGPDGQLYVADSKLARVWRIDPSSGRVEVGLADPRLAARRFIALAPGANGLQFSVRDMIVTTSDSSEVLSYRLGTDGRFAPAKLLARGIPGDDFAVGHDGALFITTHPYNTLVKVAPDGRRTIIGDGRQNIVGATQAAFGRTNRDNRTLYVVTDGGAFTGGKRTRGELVALQPY